MACYIPTLKQLHIVTDGNDGKKFIYLDDFFSFLKKNHKPTDVIKDIKKFNIHKELKGHSGLKEIHGQLAAPLKSVLCYIFHHYKQLFICRKIGEEIEKRCYDNCDDPSIKDIYNLVITTEFRNLKIEKSLLEHLAFEDFTIETLYTNYKNDYSEEQWKKICFFEHHFSKSIYFDSMASYESSVKQKRQFLDSLRNCHELQNPLIKCSKDAIIERTKRRQIDEANQAISVIANKRHSPSIFENLLLDIFPEHSKICQIICVDCTSVCNHSKAIHVYVETEEDINFEEYSLLISSHIQNLHQEACAEIVYLQKGTFDPYFDKYGKPSRFELRDDLLLRKFSERIVHVWKCQENVDIDDAVTNFNCITCYGDSVLKPLTMQSFDTLTEWSLNVPIYCQLFLESFINKKSLIKTENLEQFTAAKLSKLYGSFDSLLNLYNRNYIGLQQDINSQELAMNYRSINTVFSVTSASGATLSLNEAEQRMKEKANSDFCYYNTYLKKYDMEYETVAGLKKTKISIRECILILMMDNLVRLKYHKDPEPGESRSMQICTLPITIKGMPKDAILVDNWHDDQICDGGKTCPCKEDRLLIKDDFKNLVLNYSAAEVNVTRRFQQLMNWGYAKLSTEAFDNTLNEVHELSTRCSSTMEQNDMSQEQLLGVDISATDIKYILRMTSLILRRGGLSIETNRTVFNVYEASPEILPESILDEATKHIGAYLITKFVAQNNLFGYSKSDVPKPTNLEGPKDLLQRLRQSKGVTIRRIPVKKKQILKSERDIKEDKRKKQVSKEAKQIDHLTSEMNTCQAIVKPDCSKPKVQKAAGIQNALIHLLVPYLTTQDKELDIHERHLLLEDNNLIVLSRLDMPPSIKTSVTFATLEFAGFKFSSNANTGREYLNHAEQCILHIKHQFPNLKHIVICEEKYKFTPDDFKAATRAQRKVSTTYSISHLKTSSEVLSNDKLDKTCLISTSEGKSIASTYLAKNIEQLDIKKDIVIDIDSELDLKTCSCNERECTCIPFCTPTRAYFGPGGFIRKELMTDIKQNKGEAEISQIDWLIESSPSMLPEHSCVSIVSSGDIDAVVLHLFSVSHLWPRNQDGSFKNPVYVILKKPNRTYDIYNITSILSLLETVTGDRFIGIKLGIVLSLGGNDFLPKFYMVSHSTVLDTYMKNEDFKLMLITIAATDTKVDSVIFDTNVYKDLLKHIYCPKSYNPNNFSYLEVRQMSIKLPTQVKKDTMRNPQLWMPPETVIAKLAKNVSCLIQYYMSAGHHFAKLPDFLSDGCLTRTATGEIEYDFGEDCFVKDIKSLVKDTSDLALKMNANKKPTKRKITATPQKGRRRKMKPQASTPKKSSCEKEEK